jgi:protein-disulfide isomerase
MRHRASAALLLAAVLVASACGPRGGDHDGASAAPDATVTDRVVGYFQRAIDTPGVTFTVTSLAPDSPIPGFRSGKLEASLGERKQEVAFLVSRDGRWLFRGDPVDLTEDPRKAVMDKISLVDQPSRGPADAKVTIVEFSDFQCPYCGRAWELVEKEILPKYGDKVRFVFKQMPLVQIHPWAEGAAIASECAYQQGNDAFWTVYNGLFSQQASITAENLRAKVESIAGDAAGVDVPKLLACFDGRNTLAAVQADMKEAGEVGVNSTPTFIVNGRRVAGAQDAAQFGKVLDEELAGDTGTKPAS